MNGCGLYSTGLVEGGFIYLGQAACKFYDRTCFISSCGSGGLATAMSAAATTTAAAVATPPPAITFDSKVMYNRMGSALYILEIVVIYISIPLLPRRREMASWEFSSLARKFCRP